MCRLKVKELVAKAHATVGDLPPAQRQIMTEVITRLDTVYVALTESIELRAAVVAENAQMLRLLTDISENHDEFVNADEYMYAGIPLDYVSEINMYVSRDVNAENPFKATDAYLAEVRAQTRNELIAELEARFTELSLSETLSPELKSGAAGAVGLVSTFRSEPDNEFAAQLRQGAEHE
ncbi:hypothetical protein [Kluyvera sichuanensis]|uniref:hypothetical protein n=1 Tax=Kluyvera sichuanensis TaxID=2725494 RepID=UPI002FCEDBBC